MLRESHHQLVTYYVSLQIPKAKQQSSQNVEDLWQSGCACYRKQHNIITVNNVLNILVRRLLT